MKFFRVNYDEFEIKTKVKWNCHDSFWSFWFQFIPDKAEQDQNQEQDLVLATGYRHWRQCLCVKADFRVQI